MTSCRHTIGSVLHHVALRGDRAFGYIWAPPMSAVMDDLELHYSIIEQLAPVIILTNKLV
jgi:hypothetical protein